MRIIYRAKSLAERKIIYDEIKTIVKTIEPEAAFMGVGFDHIIFNSKSGAYSHSYAAIFFSSTESICHSMDEFIYAVKLMSV